MLASPRVIIGGTGSGCGKTTITCALLKAFHKKGKHPGAFKCGPDYIDPMFHEKVIGVPSRNLDLYLCGENATKEIIADNSKNTGISVIEGVMGFYDGIRGNGFAASSSELSSITETPSILVVNCKGRLLSAVAEIYGFKNFAPNNIKGVILNGISISALPYYKKEVEERTGLKVFGSFPTMKDISFESRHLGLITASEIDDIKDKIEKLGSVALECFDMEGIENLAKESKPLNFIPWETEPLGHCRIGVAFDKAFCFYYKDNFEILEKLGAEIVFFSPLENHPLEQNLHGLIFGGGYPELYSEELSKNKVFINSVKDMADSGIPILGECGGFLYLQDKLDDMAGRSWDMCGVLSGSSRMTSKLNRFGYSEMVSLTNNIICQVGQKIRVHEFHYSESSAQCNAFSSVKASGGNSWNCCLSKGNILAGFPHIHFKGNEFIAINFIKACLNYRVRKCL